MRAKIDWTKPIFSSRTGKPMLYLGAIGSDPAFPHVVRIGNDAYDSDDFGQTPAGKSSGKQWFLVTQAAPAAEPAPVAPTPVTINVKPFEDAVLMLVEELAALRKEMADLGKRYAESESGGSPQQESSNFAPIVGTPYVIPIKAKPKLVLKSLADLGTAKIEKVTYKIDGEALRRSVELLLCHPAVSGVHVGTANMRRMKRVKPGTILFFDFKNGTLKARGVDDEKVQDLFIYCEESRLPDVMDFLTQLPDLKEGFAHEHA